ncbi:hypothetical protein [Bradyrhizobium sp. USDA 4518]
MSVVFIALDSQGDIVEQRAEQLLAIAIARRGSEPDTLEVFTECKDRVAFFVRKRARSGMFAVREFGFGSLQFQQSAFPFCFESTRDESILRVHGAIASLGALRVVARTLDVATELRESRLVIGVELLDRLERGFQACGRESRRERFGDSRSRTVLREAGGEIPPAYSPAIQPTLRVRGAVSYATELVALTVVVNPRVLRQSAT